MIENNLINNYILKKEIFILTREIIKFYTFVFSSISLPLLQFEKT